MLGNPWDYYMQGNADVGRVEGDKTSVLLAGRRISTVRSAGDEAQSDHTRRAIAPAAAKIIE